jgi:hypothetical protein
VTCTKSILKGEVETMSPIEIGAAAGYETCRKWAHNHTVFDPIYGDDNERQRDALIGIAIAEGARIFFLTHSYAFV